MSKRTETDTFGKIDVDSSKYWGAQSQRSLKILILDGKYSQNLLSEPGDYQSCCGGGKHGLRYS
ncbi:MAG: hypothetical protein CM15mP73_3850 [Hyphomicrobiales bacterium]|nr:MAG: hypothetical protein CM15mP73_3850 [Hyphomicrobiales bacterium]